MFGDDDEEDDNTISATRYPCMPSLVGLQQMRTRCHLAFTGKKLMKWTALATGRELRKLATELQESYLTFREDMRLGYIQLARARYSSPCFNGIVLENIGFHAPITVEMVFKAFTGVKTRQIYIHETDDDSYPHLGIGRGGETIIAAKKHWRDLLKRIIVICQQRITFITIETAHRNAQRRQNAIGRVIIPRIKASIHYIIDELEEEERETFFRMKRILENKYKLNVEAKKKNSPEEKHTEINYMASEISESEKPEPEESKAEKYEREKSDSDKSEPQEPEAEKPKSLKPVPEILKPEKDKPKKPKPENLKQEKPGEKIKGRLLLPIKPEKKLETVKIIESIESTQQVPLKILEKESTTTIKSSRNLKYIDNLELGTFELETEEITKVVRMKNEDGTISERKKIIRRRKERIVPLSDSQNENIDQSPGTSNKSKNQRTISVVTVGKPELWRNIRKVQSLTLPTSQPMAHTNGKCWQSMTSFWDSMNFSFSSDDISNSMCENTSDLPVMSNNASEELLQLHEIQDDEALKFTKCNKHDHLSDSKIMFVQKEEDDNETIHKSKSL